MRAGGQGQIIGSGAGGRINLIVYNIWKKAHLRRTKCYVYLTNLFFLLTRSSHWNVLLNRLVIKCLIYYLTEVHLLVKLQAGETNKQLKWSLSRAFPKALTSAQKPQKLHLPMTASTLKHDHDIILKSGKSLKTILKQRSSRKVNSNKNLLIL